jgi:hypothetical protein
MPSLVWPQHRGQVEFRIKPVELGRTDEAVHGCGPFAASGKVTLVRETCHNRNLAEWM